MRIFRFSLGPPIRRAFRLGFSVTAVVTAQIFLFSSQAQALGLGNLTVNSFLDEPLDLRVELILDPGTDDLEQVVFDLASRKEFSIAGISRPEFMDEIQFDVLPENGKNWLRISSESQMREPFLHILLRAEWDGGSLLREYTALIDPPVYSSQAPAPVMAPRIRDEFSSANYSTAESQAVFSETESVPLVSESTTSALNQSSNSTSNDYNYSGNLESYGQESNVQALPVDEAFGVYGPIEAGETLSGIASQLQQVYPELGYYQTLYVLHRDNQDAFINGNMNLLKKGEILRVDSLEDIRNVSRELAVQVFQEQQGEWQGYLSDRGRVAPTYVSSDTPTNASQGRVGEISAQSAANGSGATTQDQFRIGSAEGAGQSSSGVTDDTLALQSEISGLESSLLSSQLENSELRERLELLEIQLDEVNQLIALEDPTLAALQQGLSTATSAGPTTQTQPEGTQAEIIASAPSESETPPSLVGVGASPANTTDSNTNGAAGNISNGRAVVDESIAGGGVAESASPAPLLIINEQSWLDRLRGYLPEIDFQNTTTMGIIGAAIAALCALLFLRRRRAQEEFEHSMLSVAVDGAHSQFDLHSVHDGVDLDDDEPDEGRVQGKDSSFLTVYNDDAATVHSDDVDPLAEAEVYLAYGRDDQAIEVLKEGLKRSNDRFDIRVKLLEIYHKHENKAEFESLAEQFYADKKVSEDKLWRKVVKMGQGLELTNPIFASTGDVMERLSSLLEVDSLEGLGITEKASEQVSVLGNDQASVEGVESGSVMSDSLNSPSSLDFDSANEDASPVTINADLDAIGSSSTSASEIKGEVETTSKFSDVVIEVESVIEEMSSVDILDPTGQKIESPSMLDSDSFDSRVENLSEYGDKVAADIETAASYLDTDEDKNQAETISAQSSEDEVLLQTPGIESSSFFGVESTLPLGSDLEMPTAGKDSVLEFDTDTVTSQQSVSESLEIPSMLDDSPMNVDVSTINLEEPSSLNDVGSSASIQFSEDLSSTALAFDTEVENLQASTQLNSELSVESLSTSDSSSLDSDFNLDLAESIEHYSEMLTPDATAVGELSELSDLMLSETASDLSESPALDSEDIQTQLDLAKVYVELGDREGAGQILKDVMDYGDPNQKKQAAGILSDLNV